jgi:ATP-binding cassette subfamily B protein
VDHPSADDLAHVPLFAELSVQARTSLAAAFETEEHASGHILVREGHSGYAFYVIADGSAAVSVAGHDVRVLEPGDHFGEIAIMDQGRRTATVTALTPVTVWTLFGTRFRALQLEEPDVTDALEAAMRERLATN